MGRTIRTIVDNVLDVIHERTTSDRAHPITVFLVVKLRRFPSCSRNMTISNSKEY
jgi:hypothetical protein